VTEDIAKRHTGIEWTDETWNPVVGCSKISAGCQNCYAINQAHRNASIAKTHANPGRLSYYEGLTTKKAGRIEWTGEVRVVLEALEVPLHWVKKPRRIFVNSMSDLFHGAVPFDSIDEIFAVMAITPEHTYQILTKRPARMRSYIQSRMDNPLPFRAALARIGGLSLTFVQDQRRVRMAQSADVSIVLPNVWLGVTVENQEAANERIPMLLETPAALRFLSCEPLLGSIDLRKIQWPEKHQVDVLRGGYWEEREVFYKGFVNHSDMEPIDWAIVGGESGPKARECNLEWLESIADQCEAAQVPVFLKQLGSLPVVVEGETHSCWKISDRKGAKLEDWPQRFRKFRQFPELQTQREFADYGPSTV
jgi:protein gp37